jgi:anti-sigma factor RsiW
MSKLAPITCREVVELVTEYLDGALSAADRERFEDHLMRCEGCQRYLDQVRTTIRVAGVSGEVGVGEMPQEQLDQLVVAFRDWKAG